MWDNLQLLFVWAPIINVQVILDGIFVGAVFALSAYGLALVWGVMNIKNLAQGCLLYTSPSPRDYAAARMPSSA